MDRVKQAFRPEFLNRIDEVIVFHALTEEQMRKIVDLLLGHVAERVEEQGLKLVITDEVKELLAREGFDKALGARPLRRAIQRLIEDALSEGLLHGDFRPGDTIEAVLEDGAAVFQKREELAPMVH
jgi:ATP-dependent Clp protease ATP-binding subunit ClpC